MPVSSGYQTAFIGNDYEVPLPDYTYYSESIARTVTFREEIIPYTYYSVLQHKLRRLPVFSASNIYRPKFTHLERTGQFKKDDRLLDFHQLSTGDYENFNTVMKATIDRGHMTKREDVQWDVDADSSNAQAAAESTFYYPNAAPQHKKLNIGIWKNLENSIIIKGRVPMPARVCVFTGPVLDTSDPEMTVLLKDETTFQVPVLFWKIVYYTKDDQKLYYAGFLMGQQDLLQRDRFINIVEQKGVKKGKTATLKEFLDFKNNQQYQVPVSSIENLTNLKFAVAIDLQKDKAPAELSVVQAKSVGFGRFSAVTLTIVEGLTV